MTLKEGSYTIYPYVYGILALRLKTSNKSKVRLHALKSHSNTDSKLKQWAIYP